MDLPAPLEAIADLPIRHQLFLLQRFMVVIGPISSLYDFTFGVLLWVFHASEALFQTGWFVESLATQTLVLFVITPLAATLGFVPLPAAYFVFLGTVTLTYLVLVEVVKRRLMRNLPA